LIYKADVSAIPAGKFLIHECSSRCYRAQINLFGVSEPVVQVQEGVLVLWRRKIMWIFLGDRCRKATAYDWATPLLELRLKHPKMQNRSSDCYRDKDGKVTVNANVGPQFVPTDLTGRYLKKATLEFDQNTREPK